MDNARVFRTISIRLNQVLNRHRLIRRIQIFLGVRLGIFLGAEAEHALHRCIRIARSFCKAQNDFPRGRSSVRECISHRTLREILSCCRSIGVVNSRKSRSQTGDVHFEWKRYKDGILFTRVLVRICRKKRFCNHQFVCIADGNRTDFYGAIGRL